MSSFSPEPKSVCPFKHPRPRCHRSDSCRERSFPSAPSPEFLTARWGDLRRPLATATLGGRVLRGRPLPPGVGAGWAGVGRASAAARWRLGRGRLLRFGANYKVAVAAASLGTARQELRAPEPSDTEDRDGEVPICQPPCPAPRRARLTLAFFSVLCRVASGTRSSSSLLHPNSGSVSALAPKTPALWRLSPVPLIACVRPTFSGYLFAMGVRVLFPKRPLPSCDLQCSLQNLALGNRRPGKRDALGRTGCHREDRTPPGR